MQAFHLNMCSWALSCEFRYREAIERADEAVDCARRAQDAPSKPGPPRRQDGDVVQEGTSPHLVSGQNGDLQG
ncbi:hypothetical protein [Streptomyces carpinensis]|uniref:Uncharacterized protein n=1 Tax=Streptomyces carpinensis TaxID=66369 RepID=A0ABV1VYW0_9ACTN|nr:hypothetical protein [Streptomyces carpinensis]